MKKPAGRHCSTCMSSTSNAVGVPVVGCRGHNRKRKRSLCARAFSISTSTFAMTSQAASSATGAASCFTYRPSFITNSNKPVLPRKLVEPKKVSSFSALKSTLESNEVKNLEEDLSERNINLNWKQQHSQISREKSLAATLVS